MDIETKILKPKTETAFGNLIVLLVSAPLLQLAESLTGEVYQPVRQLAVRDEVRGIVDSLWRYKPIDIEVRVVVATAESIRQLIVGERRPAVIHFIGHGERYDYETALLIEDECGLARPLETYELRKLLDSSGYPPCRLAVLNACYSEGLANALLTSGVRHVVAVNAKDTILSATARCFSTHFYPALLNGHSVEDSFYFGKDAVITDNTLLSILDERTLEPVNWSESIKLKLLPQNGIEHQNPIPFEQTPGKLRISPWHNTNIPPVNIDPFVGRRLDIYRAVRLLHSAEEIRCILFQSIGGMGKTALAQEVGRWQHERARWLDGVWFLNLRNLTSVSQVRVQVAAVLGLPLSSAENDYLLRSEIADKRVLLILDDLDTLLLGDPAGITTLIRDLLSCSRLKLIITSRHDLPGSVPNTTYQLNRMSREDSITAFRIYAPPLENWGHDEMYQGDIEKLMGFLDGYPFPIRLAATYMKQTRCTLNALVARLTSNPRNTLRYQSELESRDSSLYASLELSYSALPPGAKEMLPLLALFPSGLIDRAAQSIFGEASLASLETLLQFSMAEERERVPCRRFALPEPARRYAESHQPPHAVSHYAPHVLSYYYRYVKELLGKSIEEVKFLISLEQANLNFFLEWGYKNEPRIDSVSWSARTTALLTSFWIATGQFQHAVTSLNQSLAIARRLEDKQGEASVYKALGNLYGFLKEHKQSLEHYEYALNIYQKLAYQLDEADMHILLGNQHRSAQNTSPALEQYDRAWQIYKDVLTNSDALFRNLKCKFDIKDSKTDSFKYVMDVYKGLRPLIRRGDRFKSWGARQATRGNVDTALRSYERALEALIQAINEVRNALRQNGFVYED